MECLGDQPDLPFGTMTFGRYKPIYPGITSNTISVPPQYYPTNTLLYGLMRLMGICIKRSVPN
ncbi:hypothetical protein EJ377_07800 [Chryseobacterium arthrosphaerae]|uniref:Uncharacterized protein n=1 Tax=Chryseobacterium arthrosphaerae TaxID=651561 RepID=A0A3S0N652_9FLAO|nr:hypothetical protein EJ377_07800 [Chryseobacterium arthrosphaerae]